MTSLLGALGIALSIGSWSATRGGSFFGGAQFVPTIPVAVCAMALCLALAWRRRVPQTRHVLVASAVLLVIQIATAALVSPSSQAEALVLGAVGFTSEAACSTLLLFVFLQGLVNLTPRHIGIAIASGYLLVHLYDGAFLAAPEMVRIAQRPIAMGAMLAIAAGIVRRELKEAVEDDAAFDGQSGPANTSPLQDAGMTVKAWLSTAHEKANLPTYVLLACFVCVLLLVQGCYSQLTGLGSADNIQAFNLFTELFAAGVRAIVLVYCLTRSADIPLSHVSACAGTIFLVGIPAVYVSWGSDWYLIGSHIVNSARYALLPLAAIVGVQACKRFPMYETPILFVTIALTNSCYISRFVTSMLVDPTGSIAGILPGFSFASMWVVACATTAYLLVLRHIEKTAADLPASSALSQAPSTLEAPTAVRAIDGNSPAATGSPLGTLAASPALMREIDFYQKLAALCDKAQLTEREREILSEVLHGYSVDSIASRLNLSSSTVKTYLSRAYGRFGVNSRQGVLDLLGDAEGPTAALEPDCTARTIKKF